MKLFVVLLSLLVLVGCDSGQRTQSPPGQVRLVPMQIGNRQFQLEIADTPRSREKGLMHRQSMPADRGMIFAFEQEQVLSFWMRNTYIPLDILYLDKSGVIVAIRQMKPLDERSVSSGKPAKYAIELNAGTAQQIGVREGDRLQFPPLP